MNQVLAYHSTDSDRNDALCVKVNDFKNQMNYLKNNGYQVVSIDSYYNELKLNKKVPKNWIVLTFDDGTADFYSKAFPILEELRFHSTVFLITGLIGDKIRLGRKGFSMLNKDEILSLHKSGLVSFGSHTCSHRHLDRISLKEVENEVTDSKRYLEDLLGTAVRGFCYPAGRHNLEVFKKVITAGYEHISLTPLLNQINVIDRQETVLLRTGVYRKDTKFSFRIKISPLFSLLKKKVAKFDYAERFA